ncbi:MAG: hypothetical protein OHK0012_25940 [Synechococcales cyanobacterium]
MFDLFGSRKTEERRKELKVWIPDQAWGERTYQVHKIFNELDVLMKVMTYEQIQEIVRERTGARCSRETILKWKRKRGYSKPHPLKIQPHK